MIDAAEFERFGNVDADPPWIAELEADPLLWAATLFPSYCTEPFGAHQAELWRWVWSIRPGVRPAPFIAAWSRGHTKSTVAEMAVCALGARRVRTYGLYIGRAQESADDHVGNIASMLESPAVEAFYPELAERAVGKYGNSRGWRRNRLHARSGLVVDAIGLDTVARGAKVDEQRPDFMVFDDVDGELDSLEATAKKVKSITRKLLPAGAADLAVLGVQNLIQPNSVFAQLVDGRADFLADRIVSGPVPAVEDLVCEVVDGRFVIVGGRATWAGMDMTRCQEIVDDVGMSAFQAEYQHVVEPPGGGMFDHLDFVRCDWSEVPALSRVEVWVDPAVTDKEQSDSQGIQADGLGVDGRLYRLFSWEQRTSPLDAIVRAVRKAVELGAHAVGVETDQGGMTWESVFREACAELGLPDRARPLFRWEKAGAGHGPKAHRAGPMLASYERGQVVHVRGTHEVLERALRRFPLTKPLDLVDAAAWAHRSLMVGGVGSVANAKALTAARV